NVAATSARTSADLVLPPGATVKYARLYWAGRHVNLVASTTCTIQKAGSMAMPTTVMADDEWDIAANLNLESFYQSTADVTAFVQANGAGEYRVSGVDAILLPNTTQSVTYTFSGWALFVVYEQAGAPFAAVQIYDGFDVVGDPNLTPTPSPAPMPSIGATLSFALPASPTHHVSLGVLGYSGDVQVGGDSLTWNGQVVSDAANPGDNFFNSTRSALGAFVTDPNDHPQLSGQPLSMAAYDLDVVDVSSLVAAGDASATVTASATTDMTASAIDTYFLGAYVTEVRGCVVAGDCTDVDDPACNLTNGDCQVCTLPGQGGDPGACVTSTDGHRCEAGNGGSVFCGCDTQADCDAPAICDTTSHTCTAPCQSNGDCSDPTPVCDTGTGQCVQCLMNGDCSDPTPICDGPTHTCVQCESNADCSDPTPRCNQMTKSCVQCVTNNQCPNGQTCDNGTCTSGSGGGGMGGAGTSTASMGTSTSSMGTSSGGGGASTSSMGTSTSSMGTSTSSMGTSTSSMGTSAGGGNPDTTGVVVEGGGCNCAMPAGDDDRAALGAFAAVALALSGLRLRRRGRR
ncbi:MAG TPA: DUF3344 domain-containing protein, partial [Minicystis sp.]|nr:DUF3344 domain-containing protein [Minicystis sp.]